MNDFEFLFFGAGDPNFYEGIAFYIEFKVAPTEEEILEIDAAIPTIYADDLDFQGNFLRCFAEWARLGGAEMFPDPEQIDDYLTDSQRAQLNEETETWLMSMHSICPIHAVFRPVDPSSGGTRYSPWHHWSLDRIDGWLDGLETGSGMHRFLRPVIQLELDRRKPLTPGVRKHVSIGSVLVKPIEDRDEELIKIRFSEDISPSDIGYITNHVGGGLNDSIFCVADRFMDRDDLPQDFWNAIGKATIRPYGEKSENGQRAQTVWTRLQELQTTDVHHGAPFAFALRTGDESHLTAALEIFPNPTTRTFSAIRIQDIENPAARNFVKNLAARLYEDPSCEFPFFKECCDIAKSEWTFENRSVELDTFVDLLRRASPNVPVGTLEQVAYPAFQAMQSGDFATGLVIYYIVCPNQKIHTSSHCNALYAVQMDNNHQPHQPEIALELLDDCLPLALDNLDIFFNAMAVFMELEDLDATFDTLSKLAKAAVSRDYDMDKIENEPYFKTLRSDPRWVETFG